jgi:hypothetical protein
MVAVNLIQFLFICFFLFLDDWYSGRPAREAMIPRRVGCSIYSSTNDLVLQVKFGRILEKTGWFRGLRCWVPDAAELNFRLDGSAQAAGNRL